AVPHQELADGQQVVAVRDVLLHLRGHAARAARAALRGRGRGGVRRVGRADLGGGAAGGRLGVLGQVGAVPDGGRRVGGDGHLLTGKDQVRVLYRGLVDVGQVRPVTGVAVEPLRDPGQRIAGTDGIHPLCL